MTDTSQEKKLDELYELIESIEIAMFTTRRSDGRLVSRPMATQERNEIADLWFVTDIHSDKMDELEHDPHVNVSYYNMKSREWVSVSGAARVSTDRQKIRELYKPDWKAWFGKQDDVRDGGPDDPRLALILVEADSVTYLKQDKPRPVILFEVAKALVSGGTPDLGDVKQVRMDG